MADISERSDNVLGDYWAYENIYIQFFRDSLPRPYMHEPIRWMHFDIPSLNRFLMLHFEF